MLFLYMTVDATLPRRVERPRLRPCSEQLSTRKTERHFYHLADYMRVPFFGPCHIVYDLKILKTTKDTVTFCVSTDLFKLGRSNY